ncbi:MAG: hypothetical protein IIA06_05160 [Proteobacteria bacterium]|nr:hypothetical protein [Pseudomonadota bacterium]MCH8976753.1 hypothetical protein [Pseudomonadota bacterium]
MKQFLILCLISCPFLGLFSIQSAAEDAETPKYTDEQLQTLKAAEEKYKDNPGIMNMINKLKKNAGITDTVEVKKESGPPPVMAHGEVITQGSHQQAKEAIRNKDYETAIANYKVLAAEGDPEASLTLGRIYELQGDSSAAYTAYKQAAESEDNDRNSKKAAERIRWLDRKGVTGDEEIDQANQLMEESSQISGASTVKNTNSLQYKPVTAYSQLGAKPPIKPVYHIRSIKPRLVKVTLEKISNIQHFKPEKFLRVPKS